MIKYILSKTGETWNGFNGAVRDLQVRLPRYLCPRDI